jgi:hypothetical protein
MVPLQPGRCEETEREARTKKGAEKAILCVTHRLAKSVLKRGGPLLSQPGLFGEPAQKACTMPGGNRGQGAGRHEELPS